MINSPSATGASPNAALRETLVPLKALQLADGHNWSPAVREQFAKAEPMAIAALSAPAQPATAAKEEDGDDTFLDDVRRARQKLADAGVKIDAAEFLRERDADDDSSSTRKDTKR